MDERRTVVLRLNTAVDTLPLPLLDDADGSCARSDGGAGDGNFSVIHDAGDSVSAQLMRGNADIHL